MPNFSSLTLPSTPLGRALLAAAVIIALWFLYGMFGNDWARAWRRKHPINRTTPDGPWRGGFMDEKQLKELQEAYGEAMLELRARKKLQSLLGEEEK